MKRILSLLCMMAASLAEGQTLAAPASARLSPAEQNIEAARKSITGNPQQYQGYNALASALVRRAQETSDASFYAQAEAAIKNSLQMAPDNFETPALTRAAKLRKLFGDAEGAYELMELALQSTSPADVEERASLLTQMGHLRLASGSAAAADELLQQATTLIPNYPAALGDLAKICIARKRLAEAVALLEQRYQAVPRAENLYDFAEALQLAGRHDEAKRAFADFERRSLAESSAKDNSNRQLVFYYADKVQMPVKALEVAKQEFQRRHDVFTVDAYAGALHVNGQDAEARKQIETALAVGIRDASLFRHAGEIASKIGDTSAAEGYLKQSADLNALDSEQARITLTGLSQAAKQ